jgi:ERCC4-type nuclease
MSEFTIISDTREQKPFTFDEYPVDVVENTLETGDYAVQEPGYYGKNSTYMAPWAVERKGKSDLVSSITSDSRERFKREIKRAADWPAPMPIVVEAPWLTFSQGHYYSNIHPNQINGTVEAWTGAYNCQFFFRNDRADAEQFTYNMLKWWNERD